jgi:hypothetical protein
MRYAVAILLLLLVAPSCFSSKVDSGLVGTWELNVPNTDGVARWVWEIHAEGTYAFHAEGPGGVPSHSGVFEARNGKYTLRSTTMPWVDDGTYQLIQGNTLSAIGKLGRASWTRVQPAPGQTPNDSSATHRAAAEAARDIYAMYDAKTFRMKPGELVSSHAYTYRERGEARCLSRLLVNSSSKATVTCYLLVQYPTRDPVMLESELSEQVPAKSQGASNTAVERADDLLFAGIKEWALVYPSIGGGDPR